MLDQLLSEIATPAVKGFMAVAIAVTGWFVRENKKEVDSLHHDLDRTRDDLVRNYVSKNDFQTFMTEYRRDRERQEDKLDKIFVLLSSTGRTGHE